MTDPDHVEHVPVAEGVGLHVRRWDGGDRRPMLLVHGLASNARLWDGVAARLHASGHPVAAIDQRGHGRSSKPDDGYDMATVVEDLRRVVDTWWSRPRVGRARWWPGRAGAATWWWSSPPPTRAWLPAWSGSTAAPIELAERFPSWDDCAAALRPPAMVGTPVADLERMLRRSHPDWPESGIQGTLACFEVRDDGTVAPWLTLERHLLVLRGLWEHRPSPALRADRGARAAARRRRRPAAASGTTPRSGPTTPQPLRCRDGRVEWLRGDHDLHAQHPQRVADLLQPLRRRDRDVTVPRFLTVMGSGETAPTMIKVHRRIMEAVGASEPADAVLLDTPYGFQENAGDISTKAQEYFRASVGHPISVATWRGRRRRHRRPRAGPRRHRRREVRLRRPGQPDLRARAVGRHARCPSCSPTRSAGAEPSRSPRPPP